MGVLANAFGAAFFGGKKITECDIIVTVLSATEFYTSVEELHEL